VETTTLKNTNQKSKSKHLDRLDASSGGYQFLEENATMAKVSNAFDTYQSVGNREELSDIIYNITPEETPLMTLLGREKCVSRHPEWQTDTLKTPGANAVVEGNQWSFASVVPTVRVGNYTQISELTYGVTNTQETVDKAGRSSQIKYGTVKAGKELKRDMEYALLAKQASVVGADSTTARQLGSFASWLKTNNDSGSGGSTTGYNSGTGLVAAPTNGTFRAFTKTQLEAVAQKTYTSGGNFTTLMLSPYAKQVFSTFASADQLRSNQSSGKNDQITITTGADMYVSNYGPISVVANRVMATANTTASHVLLIDPDMAKVGIARPITVRDVGAVGDAVQKVINVEYTLIMKNEAAHGKIADIFGLSATT
jgi:hypothetical protein